MREQQVDKHEADEGDVGGSGAAVATTTPGIMHRTTAPVRTRNHAPDMEDLVCYQTICPLERNRLLEQFTQLVTDLC